METLLQDMRYGLRMMLKRPGFTAVIIMTLALGIGANSAIFSVVNAVLLRSLPYGEPERLMLLKYAPALVAIQRTPGGPRTADRVIPWRDRVESFEQLAAYGDLGYGINLTGEGEPERIVATDVTPNFFDTMGVKPLAGRWFLPEEEASASSQVAVISNGLWKRRFGADPNILGQNVSLNGKPFTVVGIAPPGFQYPNDVDLWIPVSAPTDRIFSEPIIHYAVIARLGPGVSIDRAQAEMLSLTEQLKQEMPGSHLGSRAVEVNPLHAEIVKKIRLTILLLFGAVAFVLLIACANITNLLLARAAGRQKEIAIRTALGAGRPRLVRQLLVESLLLSLAGGAFGLLLALWGVDLLVAMSPAELPRLAEISLNAQVFGFTMATSVVTGILFGLAPALQTSKVDLRDSLKEGISRVRIGLGYRSIRSLLVVSEVALALVLLIGAGLLIRSFGQLQAVDPGFNPANVLTLTLSLPAARYRGPAQKQDFYRQVMERLRTVPGVNHVGVVNSLPMGGAATVGLPFTLEGEPPPEGIPEKFAMSIVASTDYFAALQIPLRQGRYFSEQDTEGSAPVLVISQSMARRYWPDEDPLGKRLTLMGEKAPREVIGVVADVKQFGLEGPTHELMYFPYLQEHWVPSSLVIRTSSDPLKLVEAVRGEVSALDKDLPLYDIKTMEQRLSGSVAQRRFTLLLVTVFAALALLLAAIGIYGVMTHAVTQRTHEIGIRMALGAQRVHVLKLILVKGVIMTLAGLAIGLAAAVAMSRLIASLLYGVTATDPATFVVIPLVLAAVAIAACYIPARRATKVDPMVALRYE